MSNPFVTLSIIILSGLFVFVIYKRCLLDLRRTLIGFSMVTVWSLVLIHLIIAALDLQSILPVLLLTCAVIVIVSVISILWMFFRDPERTPPGRDNFILSPADGRVRYIHRLDGGTIPVADKKGIQYPLEQLTGTPLEKGDCWHIGIEMNLLDVHVNRIPVSGMVREVIRLPGKFLSLRDLTSIAENVRVSTLIDSEHISIAVVQISSRLVRSITNNCRPDSIVKAGDRFGMIRFGSQVDLVFPAMASTTICVHENQRVRAGETIIAEF